MIASNRAILIAGGYGVVGSRIAADLARHYPGRVVIAGRDLHRANAMAATISDARGRGLDVASPPSIEAALDDVAVVVNCVDDLHRRLLHAAIERGIQYTDITPHLVDLGGFDEYERILGAAKASGARILLGAGLVPGISSVMVRAVAEPLGGADSIQTALLLAAGDTSGPGSIAYLLRELSMSFQIQVDGGSRSVRVLSDPREVEFPPPIGRRRAYLFPFSDQVLYPITMKCPLGAIPAVAGSAVVGPSSASFHSHGRHTDPSSRSCVQRNRKAVAGARGSPIEGSLRSACGRSSWERFRKCDAPGMRTSGCNCRWSRRPGAIPGGRRGGRARGVDAGAGHPSFALPHPPCVIWLERAVLAPGGAGRSKPGVGEPSILKTPPVGS